MLVKKLDSPEEVHLTPQTKGLEDKDNPMDSINDAHSNLKAFLRTHEPFSRDNLQDFLNLYWFIFNPPYGV